MDIHEKNTSLEFPAPTIQKSPTVFIGKISLDQNDVEKLGSKSPRELFLFGGSGKNSTLEFIVVEKNLKTNKTIEHHLAQFNDSIMYKRKSDKTGYECVDMIKKKDIRFLRRLPRWKASEASIPMIGDELFYFSTQFYIPENNTTKKFFTFDETYFVFLHITKKDELLVQLYSEDTSAQSAEEHYKLEELMNQFDKSYSKSDLVEKLMKQGDKYFHEYVLEHPKTDKRILEILLKYAKTAAMKTQITKRLK